MQTKHRVNQSLFIFGLMILLFVAVCPLVQAQTSTNDIVFTITNSNSGNPEIYTMKADGSNQTNLTNNAADGDNYSDWSPDGNRIVFSIDNGIWVMNADGSNQVKLTSANREINDTPRWSSDGTKIVFSSNRSVTGGGLHSGGARQTLYV